MKLRIANCESRIARGFTLIEIMVVVAVMGLLMALGLPAIFNGLKSEGIRRAVNDLQEACNKARAQAILSGSVAELTFSPQAGTFGAAGFSGKIPGNVALHMLDVNLSEFKDAESAHVRFFPNGTCDEMTVVLQSDRNEWRMISLEVTTGLASVENDPQKFR